MAIYEFLACNGKLNTFCEALKDERMKSYNDLLQMGVTEKQINIRGIDLSRIDRDKKVFLIQLPAELENSPLTIEQDFNNAYARFLTNKKYIYKILNAEKVPLHLIFYLVKNANYWKEIELWRVIEDDYCIVSQEINQKTIYLRHLTLDSIESFLEDDIPCLLTILQ